jgi:hypothetical protein
LSDLKLQLDTTIKSMLDEKVSSRFIARRLFLYDLSWVFSKDPNRGFAVQNEISEKYAVPFSAVKIVGSAHLGYSYYKKREFIAKESDLDIALVSPQLFQKYSEWVYWTTKRYTDLSKFQRKNGLSVAQNFRDNLSMGYFRPDLMPSSSKKYEWFSFFNQLSTRHTDLFKSINAGIYLSEGFFEMKNSALVVEYERSVR